MSNVNNDTITINSEPIALYKILKLAGVATGGEGKNLIANGYVTLNTKLETRKRKKVYGGDTVQFEDELWLIQLSKDVHSSECHVISNSTQNVPRKKIQPKLS